jgi:proteasome lid subunit RPN8/RPN11
VVNDRPDALPTPDEWASVKREGRLETFSSAQASISADLLQAIIDAAREGLPNEACGLLAAGANAADGGRPTRYIPMRNAAESPYRYLIDAEEQLKVWMELEDNDEVPWGIVHSHIASAAVPSATDVGLAAFPDSLYLVCSLADPERPTVRAWSIIDGKVTEVPLAVSVSEDSTA